MQLVISINGADGAGKTTQTEKIKEQSKDFVDLIGGLECYYPFLTVKDDKSWWFEKSTPDEFCDILYASIKARNEAIKRCRKPIVLVDKGLINFDARILSTLMIKGESEQSARDLMEKYKKKHEIVPLENINIFLSLNLDVEEQQKIQEARGIYKDFDPTRLAMYKRYQRYQHQELLKGIANGCYTVINALETKEQVFKSLMETIYSEMMARLNPLDGNKQVIALGGLSESGKSSSGQILLKNHGIPNFKFNYVNAQIAQIYGIPVDSLFENDLKMFAILVWEQIQLLLKLQYYWPIISFESMHNFQLARYLKELYPANFNILYLETDQAIRVARSAFELGTSPEQAMVVVSQKDKTKTSRGADNVRQIADYVIQNDGTLENLVEILYNVVEKIKGRCNSNMRTSARGILIEDGHVLLMYRNKNNEEYYVIPGGGVEEGETPLEATIRELKEEIGIDVKVLSDSPTITHKTEDSIQYFYLVEKTSGEIGTGVGPEFTDPTYQNRGTYAAQMIPISKILSGEVNLVPREVREKLIQMLHDTGKRPDDITGTDLIPQESTYQRKHIPSA